MRCVTDGTDPRKHAMRIMIDGLNLALSQGTGVATYARNLSYCIKQNGHHLSVLYGKPVAPEKDPLLREAMFFDNVRKERPLPEYYLDLIRSFAPYSPSEIPQTGQVLREQIAESLPNADVFYNIKNLFFKASAKFEHFGGMLEVKLPEQVDIAHWTYPAPIRIKGARNIYTMHDIVPIKLPYTTLDVKRNYINMLRSIARSADHIVTVSDVSKRDIVDTLGISESKVTNTYQSVSIPQSMLQDSDSQLDINLETINPDASLNVKGGVRQVRRGEFFLYVGAIEPKKNLKRILEGYLASGASQPLVVVGRQAWQCETEMKMIERATDRIVYLDYVPFTMLVTLMRSARALIFASLYEGFGLPVLEAFQCGAPVITADASSTAEVAGDAALLVDPYDICQIRDAFRALGADGTADLRREMAEKGRRRAEAFSQDKIAVRLEECYSSVMQAA